VPQGLRRGFLEDGSMRANSGFTLIELILVTVIIGILAGTVALNFSGRVEQSMISAAKKDIVNYNTAIDLYALDNNDVLPKSLDDLTTGKRNYLKGGVRKDPWGNDYVYKTNSGKGGSSYEIICAGADGAPGTEDDVTLTSEHEEEE
jgi:general secretion pathway protein G